MALGHCAVLTHHDFISAPFAVARRHRGWVHGIAERRGVFRLFSAVEKQRITASSPQSIERSTGVQEVGAVARGAARSTDRPGAGEIYRLCSFASSEPGLWATGVHTAVG